MRFVAIYLAALLHVAFSQDQFCLPPNFQGIVTPSPPNADRIYPFEANIRFSCTPDSLFRGSRMATCRNRVWVLDTNEGIPSCRGGVIVQPTILTRPITRPIIRPTLPVVTGLVCPGCPSNGVCTLHDGRPACICPPGYFRTERACIPRTQLSPLPSCLFCQGRPDTTCHTWRGRPVCVCNPTHFRYFMRSTGGGFLFSSSVLVATCAPRPVVVVPPTVVRCSPPVLASNVILVGGLADRPFWNLGDRINFACSGLYVINGRRSAVCQANGRFSTNPTCRAATPPRSTLPVVVTPGPTQNFCTFQNIPAPPNFGRLVNAQNRLYSTGETVSYECLPGYVLNGDRTSICENGVFSRVVNFCRAVVVATQPPTFSPSTVPIVGCIIPIAPQNGRITPPSRPVWRAGDTVTYSCLGGFILRGTAVATCLANGEFTSPPAGCTPAGVCEPPVVPFMGSIARPGKPVWNVGDRATYSCNSGYTLVGERVLTCLATLEYSSPFPFCINNNPRVFVSVPPATVTAPPVTPRPVARCSNPPIPQFAVLAEVGKTIWFENEILRFECTSGYNLVGQPSVCQSNGLFSDVTSSCIAIPTCSQGPAVPTNGFLDTTLSAPYSIGTVLNFGCQVGFTLIGSTSATCQADGTFSNAVNFCNQNAPNTPPPTVVIPPPVQCLTRPSPPQNGFLNTTSVAPFTNGQVIAFACFSGFSLIGDTSTTCLDGSFTVNFPFCNPNPAPTVPVVPTTQVTCARPNTPQFGEIIEQDRQFWFLGEVINYNCFEGFMLSEEEETATCGVNGFPPVPVCQRIFQQQCTPPPEPMFGSIRNELNIWSVGDVARYKCEDGFELSDPSATLTCVARAGATLGEYSGTLPTCNVIAGAGDICTAEAPLNGILRSVATRYSLGEVVRYACAPGFDLTGSEVRLCQADGSLSGEVTVCTDADASVARCFPVPAVNGILIPTATSMWFANDLIIHQCLPGYTFQASSLPTQFCQISGEILGNLPVCVAES